MRAAQTVVWALCALSVPALGDEELNSPEQAEVWPGGPKFAKVTVVPFLLRWRSVCARPGVTTCQQYDALDPTQRPKGDTINFVPSEPMSAFAMTLEFFPMAMLRRSPLRGLGLIGAADVGVSTTNVTIQTPSGQSTPEQVVSV